MYISYIYIYICTVLHYYYYVYVYNCIYSIYCYVYIYIYMIIYRHYRCNVRLGCIMLVSDVLKNMHLVVYIVQWDSETFFLYCPFLFEPSNCHVVWFHLNCHRELRKTWDAVRINDHCVCFLLCKPRISCWNIFGILWDIVGLWLDITRE